MAEERLQLTYVEAKRLIIEAPLRCAEKHDSGQLVGLESSINGTFEDIDNGLRRNSGPELTSYS